MKRIAIWCILALLLLAPSALAQWESDWYGSPPRPLFSTGSTANVLVLNTLPVQITVVLISRRHGCTEAWKGVRPNEVMEFGHFPIGLYSLIVVDPIYNDPKVYPFSIDRWCSDCTWDRRSDREVWKIAIEDWEFRKVIKI